MYRIWLLFFILSTQLFGIDPETSIVIDTTSCHVQGVVYAPTGQSNIRRTDAVISGFEPIPVTRIYSSENSTALDWTGGWTIFPGSLFILQYTDRYSASIQEPDGTVVHYEGKELVLTPKLDHSYGSPFSREISARTDIRNQKITFHYDKKRFYTATLHLSNGGEKIYRYKKEQPSARWVFALEEEIKPNGHRVLYKHDDAFRIEHISTWNPQKTKQYASLCCNYQGKKTKDRNCSFTGSDGSHFSYRFWRPQDDHLHNFFYFEAVVGEGVVEERVMYDVGYEKEKNTIFNKTRAPFVKDIQIGNFSTHKLEYYYPGQNKPAFWDFTPLKNARDHVCDKVLNLQEPVGPNESFIPTHSFRYEHCTDKGPGITKVKDLYGNKTHYHFDVDFRPTKIEFYSPTGLVRVEIFLWAGRDLAWHIFQDPKGENSYARRYWYDRKGNVELLTIYGNLTGTCKAKFDIDQLKNGIESYSIRYKYSDNGFNLPVQKEEENGLKMVYAYKEGTDLLCRKIVYDREKIISRYFAQFNDDNFLCEEITDNGKSIDCNDFSFTERKIIRYTPNDRNLNGMIEEKGFDLKSGMEVLLKRKVLHYNDRCQIEREEIYDSEDQYRYTTQTNYESGLISWQTDPLNQKTTYAYNERQQLKERSQPGCAKEIFEYARSGELKEKKLVAEESQTTTFEYNALHHKISETNPTGAKTILTPNRFGSAEVIQAPLALNEDGVEVERNTICKYDFLNREIYRRDPNGDETETRYNAYGKPVFISRADGSEETFTYYKNGALHQSIDPEKTKTVYKYDVLQRLLSKEIFSVDQKLLSKETKIYDSFHLRSYIDPLGITTVYEYDVFGRKISEKRDQVKTEYAYSCLDGLHKTTQGELVHVVEQDFLGRTTQERKESLSGEVLYKKEFVYKDEGRLVEEIAFPNNLPATTTHEFDRFQRPIQITNPEGHVTQFAYSINPQFKTTTDALGRTKIETINPLGKTEKVERRDEFGKTISLEEYFYDLGANLACQRSSVYQGNTFLKTIETKRVYGPLNRLEKLIEAAGSPSSRETSYTYTKKGLLEQTIKPSGKVLQNRYNALGYLIDLESLDGSVHYLFEPNALGLVTSTTDLNTGLKTTRTPDHFGNILKENISNGFVVERTYDASNRCKTLKFPDGSEIIKTYDPLYLREVSYEGLTHQYTEFDLSGNLLSEELCSNTGTLNYKVDSLSRTTSIASPWHTQQIGSFDPVGKVEALHTQLPTLSESINFAYDSLGQLTEDGVHVYSCDSHYNRLSEDDVAIEVDDLNQLGQWEYDLDGNPRRRGDLTLSYDGLDRLVGVELPDHTQISYTYDPFHRRMTKILPDRTIRYLYDGNNEIGFEDQGELSIRILGITSQAEIGAAVALKLNGSTYVPLHDLQGSVSLLIDPVSQLSLEEALYSPFGQKNLGGHFENPWRYLSKQTDAETGFVFFGRRYYAPSSGRFLTLDPKGYTDSCNLYAYALNDPFLLVDPYGLENEASSLGAPISDATLTTITSIGTSGVSGLLDGLGHPYDSLKGLSSDLTFLASYAFNGNFSTLTAAWKAMDWEERLGLISFQSSRIVGLGLTVSGLGATCQLGLKLTAGVYIGGRVLIESVAGRMAFAKNATSAIKSIEQVGYSATKGAGQTVSQLWPPNNGFLSSGRASLVPGAKVDRLGGLQGRFLAVEGTPLPMRSMSPDITDTSYRVFEVMKSFEIEAGQAAPWFNQPGMGLQFKTDIQIKKLVDEGYLNIIKEILK